MSSIVKLAERCASLSQHWAPQVVATANGQELKVARALGEFHWHRHAQVDETFLVLSGELVIELRDGEARLGPGELFVVPRNVEHRPIAAKETAILVIEPSGVDSRGD